MNERSTPPFLNGLDLLCSNERAANEVEGLASIDLFDLFDLFDLLDLVDFLDLNDCLECCLCHDIREGALNGRFSENAFVESSWTDFS